MTLAGIDYGPRRGTLGWNIHIAEGGDGTAQWLAQRSGELRSEWVRRVNGVSANFVIKSTGAYDQMVGWDRAAGNLNPSDRSTDKAFYGRRFLLEVLGDHWADPNAYTLSAELCGFRAQGPTAAQLATLEDLIAESRQRFPTIRGAFGHADQTDTKGCPGTSPAMLAFWQRVGHGLFTEEDDLVRFTKVNAIGGSVRITENTAGIPIEGGDRPPIATGLVRPVLGSATLDDLDDRLCYLMWVGPQLCWVAASVVEFTANDGPNPPPDIAAPTTYSLTIDGAVVAEGSVTS